MSPTGKTIVFENNRNNTLLPRVMTEGEVSAVGTALEVKNSCSLLSFIHYIKRRSFRLYN